MSPPWSSTLTAQFLSLAADQLNAIDHVRFRSVCSLWRNSTRQRNTGPLIILCDTGLDKSQEEKPINALSFFDTVRKETIPCPATINDDVRNSYFLGSSHGFMAFGGFDPQLKIVLMNPFTGDFTKLPMLLDEDLGGRVLLSGSPMAPQIIPMVVYHRTNSTQVCFMRIGDRGWRRLILPGIPQDIITADGLFYVNYGPQLFVIDLDKNWLSPAPVPPKFPGVFPNWVSPNLKFIVNSSDKLFVACTLSFQRKDFRFMHMDFYGIWPPITAYVDHQFGQYCYPVVVPGNRPLDVVNVLDYHPYGPFSWFSKFWSDGQHPWEPVGWIFPNLNTLLES